MGIIENLIKLEMCCLHFPCTEGKFSAATNKDVTCCLVLPASRHHTAPMGADVGVEVLTPTYQHSGLSCPLGRVVDMVKREESGGFLCSFSWW